MTREESLLAEISRLQEALCNYGCHDEDCVAGQWRAGRPTDDGGYETLFGYGKQEKWYQRGQWPECTCGFADALKQSELLS